MNLSMHLVLVLSYYDQAFPLTLPPLLPLRAHASFPVLQRELAGAVLGYIRSGAEPAERMIRSLVECEHDFINTDHPEFIGGRGAIRAVMQERSLRAAAGGRVTKVRGEGAAVGKGWRVCEARWPVYWQVQ